MRLLLRWRKLCSTMPVKEPATTRGMVPPRPRKTWCDQIKPSLWPKTNFQDNRVEYRVKFSSFLFRRGLGIPLLTVHRPVDLLIV
jgi:hypothetical protein